MQMQRGCFDSGEIPLIALRLEVSVICIFMIHNHANIVWECKTLNAFIESCIQGNPQQKGRGKGREGNLV